MATASTVTESNTKATLEYLLNNYRAQLDARGKTGVKTMLRSNDSYIQAIAPTVIPAIVKREQFHDFVMADWRYRLEDAGGKNTYGPFVGGAANSAADIRASFGKLPIGFKTPPYPGNLYLWEDWQMVDAAVRNGQGAYLYRRWQNGSAVVRGFGLFDRNRAACRTPSPASSCGYRPDRATGAGGRADVACR